MTSRKSKIIEMLKNGITVSTGKSDYMVGFRKGEVIK